MNNEAPVRVAVWPPLAVGATPSICGKAHNHFLSATKSISMNYSLVIGYYCCYVWNLVYMIPNRCQIADGFSFPLIFKL
jgi:hypothetical protein